MAQGGSREASVTIGDRSFRLCFSILGIVALRDFWKLEDDSACLARLDEIGKNFQKGRIDFRTVSEVIWGGLQEHHAGEITPMDVLKLLSAAGIGEAPRIMTEAFKQLIAASPSSEGRQAGPTKANRRGKSASTN
jgi:hypothetical protein